MKKNNFPAKLIWDHELLAMTFLQRESIKHGKALTSRLPRRTRVFPLHFFHFFSLLPAKVTA